MHMKVPHDCPLGSLSADGFGVAAAETRFGDAGQESGAASDATESLLGAAAAAPGPYSHPEAYDIINAPGTPDEVNGLERLFSRVVLGLPRVADARAARALTWLEPCSGSGRFVRVIASRMAREAERRAMTKGRGRGVARVRRLVSTGRVMGIDLDPGMVAYTRERIEQRGLEQHASVVRADIRRFTPRALAKACDVRGAVGIDAAFCLHNSIRHMTSERDLLQHLRAMAKVLSTRGAYAVGVELTPPEQMMTSESVFVGMRAGVRVREVFNYLPPDEPFAPEPMETVMTHLEMSRVGGGGGASARAGGGRADSARRRSRRAVQEPPSTLIAEWSTTYHLRCWSLEDWQRIVQKAGLRESGVYDSWGTPLNPLYRRYALRVLQRA